MNSIKVINRDFNVVLNNQGVYFLINKNTNSIYIGESENIINRLNQYINHYESLKKDDWERYVIVFMGNNLDKDSSRYIEKQFFYFFKKNKFYIVQGKSAINYPKLSDSKKMFCDEYINISIDILKSIGFYFDEESKIINDNTINFKKNKFILDSCNGKKMLKKKQEKK